MKGFWKAGIGITISALLLWWVFRDTDPAEVWREVRGANWTLLLASIVVGTAGFGIRAMRWEVLLRPVRAGTGLAHRFMAVSIGFAVNNVLPARVGEFARAWSLSRLEPVSVSGAVGSLVAERFLDGIVLIALIGVAVLHPSFPSDATVAGRPLGDVFATSLLAAAGVILCLILLLSFPRTLLALVRRLGGLLPGKSGDLVLEIVESFIRGLGALRHPGLLAAALAWSFVFWMWNGLAYWLAIRAFSIDAGYIASLFVQSIVSIGSAVPAAPGYVGTFHAGALIGLHEVYGFAEEPTLGFAFGFHLGGFLPITLIGLWFAGRMGLSLSELGKADETVEEALDRELGG